MTNVKNSVLYVGVTNDLERRSREHKNHSIKGFTDRYNLTKLVYFQEFRKPLDAIGAEKKIKGWLRRKKISLIESINPEWNDLLSD